MGCYNSWKVFKGLSLTFAAPLGQTPGKRLFRQALLSNNLGKNSKNILVIENVAYLCSPKFLKGRRYL
jgi:hypothetical protein